MTIKKSDVQALLDKLPDEFESELFDAGYALLNHEERLSFELSEEQWQLVFDATEELKAGKGINLEEAKKRIAAWNTQ